MYAVIQTGGKQYRVTEGQTLKVEKLDVEVGGSIDIDKVLMVTDGDNVKVGTPYVGKVKAKVVSQGRDKKVTIIKFRRRKHSRKQMGHRQSYTEIEISSIAS